MSKRHLLRVGDRVEFHKRPGKIVAIDGENYTVDFDDGEREVVWRAVSYVPTPEQIAEQCAAIRRGLSARELEAKAADPQLRTQPVEVHEAQESYLAWAASAAASYRHQEGP